MAFDKKPSTWLGAGYASSSGAHTITLNTNDASSNKTLPQLSDVNADPTTGDIREVAFALAEALYQAWLAQGVNIPNKMKVTRSASAGAGGTVIYNYGIKITLAPTGQFPVAGE